MKNTQNKKNFFIWIFSLIALCFFLGSFICLFVIFGETNHSTVRTMNSGWTVSYNDTSYAYSDLTTFRFKGPKANEIFVLKNTLPDHLPSNSVLSMCVFLSTIEVKVADEVIYRYGYDLHEQNKMVGSGYHIFDLSNDMGGKEIEITIIPREANAFTAFEEIKIGKSFEIYSAFMQENLIVFMVYLFLTVLGAGVLVIAIFSLRSGYRFLRFIPISLFSFIIGMYGLSSSKIFEMLGTSLYANTVCEYVTLYMAPIPVILIFTSVKKISKKYLNVLYSFVSGWVVFVLALLFLHFRNIIHFPKALWIFHLFGGISLILGVVVLINSIKNRVKLGRLNYIGFLSLCGAAICDLFRFNIQKYLFPNSEEVRFSLLPIGTLLFILLMLIDYMISMYHAGVEESEKKILARLAYVDELCQIPNRTKCKEKFAELENNDARFALILFDLNHLKHVNDTYGHSKGDMLIKTFAGTLKEIFREVGQAYRVGGDEFIVIVENDRIDKIEQTLSELRDAEKRNSEKIGLPIHSSYGVAYSNEIHDREINKVYAKADQRMYEMKNEYHKK